MEFEAKQKLMARLDESLLSHARKLTAGDDPRVENVYRLQGLAEVHSYLKTEHQFDPAEVDVLLQFADPLDVAYACWEINRDEYDFPICDLMQEIRAEEFEPAKSELPAGRSAVPMSEKTPHEVNMTYSTMRNYFRAAERAGQHLTGYIVMSPASFEQEYSLESRTYVVSSDNKAFQPNMGGYSIFASSLDGSDPCVRLEQYMAAEYGGKDGWQIERCYMMSDEVERAKALTRTEKEHER
ncbi:MAG: hypothetical protein J1E06_01395 [Acutalibacter sp.]|nr:hypothetical protein [Acutalibacter sp.]